VNIPEGLAVVEQSGDGGTWKQSDKRWVWTTIRQNEQVTPSVTVAVPSEGGESYSITGEVLTNEQSVAEATSKVTVQPADGQTIQRAIDTNNNNIIDDTEILQAIEYWRNDEQVPETSGRTINDIKILELIEMWRNDTEVN
jgi:hypothetical protein